LCLCRLCQWSSDEGLMSVGDGYEVLVSGRVRTDRNRKYWTAETVVVVLIGVTPRQHCDKKGDAVRLTPKKRSLWPFSGAKTAGKESVWDGPFFYLRLNNYEGVHG
jgi:hypothetical protein